jgi:hypothetical protein
MAVKSRGVSFNSFTVSKGEKTRKGAAQGVPVLHHDETGVRVAGRLQWGRVSSPPMLTYCSVHARA